MKVTTKMLAHKRAPSDLVSGLYQNEDEFQLWPTDMSEYGYVCLGEVDVEFEINPPSSADLVAKEIEGLERQKDGLLAETNRKVQAIQDKINSLLCLEYKQ